MTLVAMVLGLMAVLLFGGYIRDINYACRPTSSRARGHLQIQHKDYFRLGSGNPAAYGIARLRADHRYRQAGPGARADAGGGDADAAVRRHRRQLRRRRVAHGLSSTAWSSKTRTACAQWNDYGLRILSQPPVAVGHAAGHRRHRHRCRAGAAAVRGAGRAGLRRRSRREPKPQGAALPDDIAALASSGAGRTPAPRGAGQPRIEILAANARGAPNVAAVSVLRAEFQGIKELDDVYVGMHLSQAQKLIFGAAPPQVTAIVLQLQAHGADPGGAGAARGTPEDRR